MLAVFVESWNYICPLLLKADQTMFSAAASLTFFKLSVALSPTYKIHSCMITDIKYSG